MAAQITESFKMIVSSLRASTVVCSMALLASPALADVTITVINNTFYEIDEVWIEIELRRGPLVAYDALEGLTGLPHQASLSFNAECTTPSGLYRVALWSFADIRFPGDPWYNGPTDYIRIVCGDSAIISLPAREVIEEIIFFD